MTGGAGLKLSETINVNFPEHEIIPISKLSPFENNSRTHSDDQIKQVANSIKEFGFTNPILIDEKNTIIAGHGRVLAAKSLDMAGLPAIRLTGLSDTQRRALVIADNQLALNADWDMDKLKYELSEIIETGFDVSVLGFDDSALDAMLGTGTTDDSAYSRKVEAPTYTPSDEVPPLGMLFNTDKADSLIEQINSAGVSDDEKAFLRAAAERHTVFDFAKIADYYAAASAEMQNLMESSALVIIDFDKAIAGGFVKLSHDVLEQYAAEYDDDDA